MPVSVILHLRDGIAGDARAIHSRDVFIVTTDPPGNADTSNPTGIAARAAGLPPLLTLGVRPDGPAMRADCYESCRPLDAQIGTKWEVVVRYSSTGNYRFEPYRDKTNVTYKTHQDSSVKMVMEIPYFSIGRKVAALGGGGTATSLLFIRGVTKLDVAMANPQVRVNVNTFTANDRSIIRGQLNKIHGFNTTDQAGVLPAEPARFVAYEVQEHAEGLWTIVYSWIQDPGTPGINVTSAMLAQGIAAANALPLATAAQYKVLVCATTRGPFDSYAIVPATDTNSPDIRVVRQYAMSDITGYNGANNLPGAPI